MLQCYYISSDKGYLLIYGKHINGYYCCIPNWSVGCEMSSSESTGYNRDKLIECGINEDDAIQLAKAIKLIVTESNS